MSASNHLRMHPPLHANTHSCSTHAPTHVLYSIHTCRFLNSPPVSLTGSLSCSHPGPSATDTRLPDDSTAPAGAASWHHQHYRHGNERETHTHTSVSETSPWFWPNETNAAPVVVEIFSWQWAEAGSEQSREKEWRECFLCRRMQNVTSLRATGRHGRGPGEEWAG